MGDMKRYVLALTLIAILLVTAALLSACVFVDVRDVHLHFVLDGYAYADLTVSAYSTSGLNVGVKEGYNFDGWYSDAAYTTVVDPSKVTEDATLYGRWVKDVPRATQYTVRFVSDEGAVLAVVSATSLADLEAKAPTAPEREGYVFNEWFPRLTALTADAVLTATYRRLYVVTFVSEEGTVLSTQVKPDGSAATEPIPPQKQGDAQYSYTFAGWSCSTGDYREVHADMTVRATYSATVNRYQCTFYLQNGAPDDVRSIAYGSTVSVNSPAKASTTTETYSFVGWDVDDDGVVDNTRGSFVVTADLQAWAVYDTHTRLYTVHFDVDGVDTVQKVQYRGSATYPDGTPTRAATARYTYAFAGWDTDDDGLPDDGLASIEANTTAVAVFDHTTNRYRYYLEDEDGNLYLPYVEEDYGTPIVIDYRPTKEGTQAYTYAFEGWRVYSNGISLDDGVYYVEDMPLEEDVHFVAEFSRQIKLYTVNFRRGGNLLAQYQVPYGAVIDYDAEYRPLAFPSNTTLAYSWRNWAPGYEVTGDFDFYLDNYAADYTVTWVLDAEQSFDTYYKADTWLGLPADPTCEGYVFVGWQGFDGSVKVNQNMTFNAIWAPVSDDQ